MRAILLVLAAVAMVCARPTRLAPSPTVAHRPTRLSARSSDPTISNTPDLPSIDWSSVGQSAPTLVSSSSSSLPKADTIVITWTEAEWAALVQVFIDSSSPMSYSKSDEDDWSGWNEYSTNLPSDAPSGWDYWGKWRLVEISGSKVLLWKSNTHLDFPGQTQLADMMTFLVNDVEPTLVLSIGTAGGAQTGDHLGTVRISSSATLYNSDESQSDWDTYSDSWSAPTSILNNAGFASLLFPIPTTTSDLDSLKDQFNDEYNTDYTLLDLNPGNLNKGDPTPNIVNQSGGSIGLLTATDFLVGTTAGDFDDFTVIEEDDAILAQVCKAAGVLFGSVRNVSDPVQSSSLPSEDQKNWGSYIYDSYGFYTAYNGAVAAWAVIAAQS